MSLDVRINQQKPVKQQTSYHKFPSDKQRRKTWLERIRRSNTCRQCNTAMFAVTIFCQAVLRRISIHRLQDRSVNADHREHTILLNRERVNKGTERMNGLPLSPLLVISFILRDIYWENCCLQILRITLKR